MRVLLRRGGRDAPKQPPPNHLASAITGAPAADRGSLCQRGSLPQSAHRTGASRAAPPMARPRAKRCAAPFGGKPEPRASRVRHRLRSQLSTPSTIRGREHAEPGVHSGTGETH